MQRSETFPPLIKCPNCGAGIEADAPKCPHCGYINEAGAEKEYMEHLDDVRKQLDGVDEEAAAEYGKGYKRVIRIIVITLTVVALVALFFALIAGILKNKARQKGNVSGEDTLKEMSWQHENFPKYDELYEAKEYDELAETMYSEYEHDVFKWAHYDFITAYMKYSDTVKQLEQNEKSGWNKYGAASATYSCMYFYYKGYDEQLDDDEKERLKPYADEMEIILHERLGYTDSELAALREQVVNKYGSVDFDACDKLAKENIDRYN